MLNPRIFPMCVRQDFDAPRLLCMQLLRSEEGAEYSAMDATADGNTAYLADKDGAVEVVDTRQAADAKPAAVGSHCVSHIPSHSLQILQSYIFALHTCRKRQQDIMRMVLCTCAVGMCNLLYACLQEISLHEKKINTLSLEPGSEHLLATGWLTCCSANI
jgi:hypothetical protein